MGSVNGYFFAKEMVVIVTYRASGKSKTIECYDDGNGVTKEEKEFLWVRTKHVLSGTSDEWSKPKWEPVDPLSKIEYTIVNEDQRDQ